MEIRYGTIKASINGEAETSIVDFFFDGYLITVFQGTISAHDYIVKYKRLEPGSRLRQPSHTQWAVDFLMKIQGNKKLAHKLLEETDTMWKRTEPLENNDFETLKELIENDEQAIQIEHYRELDHYGEYSVEFLFILMRLLAAQEKTNNPNAYMFGEVIEQLLKDDVDIYKVLSSASFHGRGR